MPTHLPLALRKTLSARLIGLDAVLALYARAGAEQRQQLDEFIADVLQRYADYREVGTDDDTNLDEHLKAVARQIHRRGQIDVTFGHRDGEGNNEPGLPEGASRRLPESYERVVARLGKLSCLGCSEDGKYPVCTGVDDDALLVDAAGRCIAPLRDLFRLTLKAAAAWYGRLVPGFDQFPRPVVTFATGFHTNHPTFRFSDDFHVKGRTDVEPDDDVGGRPRATVQLSFNLAHFSRPCYLSVLYVLFHECFVHAFQSLHPSARRRNTDSGQFIEGWMDWVSYKILCQELALQGSVATELRRFFSDRELDEAQIHLDEIERFHRERKKYIDDGPSAERHDGAQVAGFLYKRFQVRLLSSLGAGDAALQEMARLSLSLNSLYSSTLNFDGFVRVLRAALLDPGAGVNDRVNRYLDAVEPAGFDGPQPVWVADAVKAFAGFDR